MKFIEITGKDIRNKTFEEIKADIKKHIGKDWLDLPTGVRKHLNKLAENQMQRIFSEATK